MYSVADFHASLKMIDLKEITKIYDFKENKKRKSDV